MADTLKLSVILGAATSSSFGKVFGNANAQVGALGQALKATHVQLNQVHAFQRTGAALDETRLKLGATQQKVMALRKAIAAGDTSTKLANQLGTTQAKAVKLSATLGEQRIKLRQEGDALRKAGIDTRDLNTANERLTVTFNKQKVALGANYAQLEKRKALRGQLMGQIPKLLGAAVFGRKAIASAVDFESAMADVKKVVNFDTPEQFKQMGEDITQLSLKVPMARSQIAAIVAAAGQKGIQDKSELLQFAEDAAKMAIAFDTTAEDSAETMGQWRKAFGLTQKQVETLGDQVNLLGNTAGASSLDIGQIISKVGPLGKVGGLAGGQIAALGATIRAMGIDTDIAGTGVKNLMLGMGAGAAATPMQRAAFKSLGIDAVQLSKHMQTDATGAILHLLEAIKLLPKAAQAATLTQLFGKESVAAIAPLLSGLDQLKANLERVGDAAQYSGSMQQEYLSRASTTGAALQVGKDAWDALTGSIGQVFLPTIKSTLGVVVKATALFVDFSNRFPKLTAGLVGATAAAFTFKTAVLGLKVLGTFIPGMNTFGGLVRALVPGLGLAKKAILGIGVAMRFVGAAMLANPVILGITLAAALLAGAAYLVYKNWGPIKDFFTGIGTWIGDTLGGAASWITGKFSAAADGVKGAWNTASSWIANRSAIAAQDAAFAWHHPLQFIQSQWEGVKVGAAMVGDWFTTHMPKTAAFVSNAWSIELKGLGAMWDWLKAKATVVIGWITKQIEWVSAKWNTLKNIPGAVVGKIGSVGASISNTVGGVLGDVGGPTPALAGGYAMPAIATRGNVTHYTAGPTTIQIHASPGMDEKAIGDAVSRKLDERDRQQAARRRSSLGDLD